jgi:calmodulin
MSCPSQAFKLTKKQYTDYKAAFDLLDKDRNGTISVAELGTAMKSIGLDPSEGRLKKMIKSVDSDKSGSLSFPEFAKLLLQELNKDKIEEIKEFLSDFDTNRDGMITKSEVQTVFKQQGNFSDETIERIIDNMMAGADFNKDEKINIEGLIQ